MRATLEFDLPDDEYEYRCALNGADYLQVIRDLDRELRSAVKWEAYGKDKVEGASWARDTLWEMLDGGLPRPPWWRRFLRYFTRRPKIDPWEE